MAWKDLTARERITAASFDIMRDPEFSLLGGATQIGAVEMVDPEELPTAGTNGRDVVYCTPFVMGLTRPQVRMLVAHETIHKMLHHCIEYTSVCEKYPHESNMAMDYVDNLIIEELDAGRGFIEWIDAPPPLIDQKYKGWSFLEVLQDILKNPPPTNPNPKSGSGKPQPLDTHTQGKKSGVSGEKPLSEEEAKTLKQQMQDAVAQGQIVREKLQAKARGDKGSGGRFDAMNQQRTTDWKGPLRRFIAEQAEGDEQSRFSPPNKRFLPLNIILPSHYSERIGEIVIAADTSGSMYSVMPVVLGEIARICQQVKPAAVRMLFWDTKIAGDQLFTERDYDKIAKVLRPAGGGGTTVSCVAEYIKEKKIKAKCVVMITDAYIETSYDLAPIPHLWGVVDHPSWVPRKGKKVDINSAVL